MGDYASFNIISVYIWYDNQFYWLRRSEYTGKSPSSHWYHYVVSYLFISVSCKSNRPQFCYFWGIPHVTLKIFMLKIACWLLINIKWAIFQPYHGENKIHFHERSMMSALYQANRLSLICIVLQQSAGIHLSTGTHYPDSEPQLV